MAEYQTFGPYDLERDGHRLAKSALKNFWQSRENDSIPGLGGAIGVYVFSVVPGPGQDGMPWYIGRTDKQSFQVRLSQQDLHFRQVLETAKSGQLQVFFVALMAPSGKRFRKPTKTRKTTHNEWLESALIGSALSRNRKLINASKVKFLKTLVVPGYLNSPKGKLSNSAAKFQDMLDLK